MNTHMYFQPADPGHRISSLTKLCGISWMLVTGSVLLSSFGSWGPCGPVDAVAGLGFLAIIFGVPVSLAISFCALMAAGFRRFRAHAN